MAHILDHQVHMAAIAAFRLGRFQDRATYPICLPILSVLVNYGKSAAAAAALLHERLFQLYLLNTSSPPSLLQTSH